MAGLGATSSAGISERVESAVNGLARDKVAGIQRMRLLTAMVEVASEYGFADASVARIVTCAGVSRRTFYELFEDREECFLAAFDEGVARASRYVLDRYDPKAGWVERIRGAVTAMLGFLDVERRMGELLLVGSLAAGAGALERRQRLLTQLVAFVDEGRGRAKSGSAPPPLTAEGAVGGVLSVLQSRLRSDADGSLLELAGPLVSMIVLPYRGLAAAQRELSRPVPAHGEEHRSSVLDLDPLHALEIRLTYRTVRVLLAVAEVPGASNRAVAVAAGIADQGQISKLLGRLKRLGLVQNTGLAPDSRGAPNAWVLTTRGCQLARAMSAEASLRDSR